MRAATAAAATERRFHAALIDYFQSPGRYALALQEPPELFASIRDVLQLASGRVGPDTGPVPARALQQAACYFVRSAMLHPGADHYALLGLDRSADDGAIKKRYRLMMRLVHPDFAGSQAAQVAQWPQDAAVRLNLAYQVLSSAAQRRDYDRNIAASTFSPRIRVRDDTPLSRPSKRVVQPAAGRRHDARRILKTAVVLSAAGAAALLAAGLLGESGSAIHLVQRAAAPVFVAAAPPAVARPEPSARRAGHTAVPSSQDTVQLSLASPRTEAATPDAMLLQAPVAIAPAAPVGAAPAEPVASDAVGLRTTGAALPSNPPPPAVAPAAEVARTSKAPANVPTLAQAQPILARLLESLESGRSDRMLNLLDTQARKAPEAVALSQQYERLIDASQPVKLTRVDFIAEPAEGRLLVTGRVHLHTASLTIGAASKRLVLRAEFASRDGAIVLTALSGSAGE
jgi:hypothetical protein